MSPTECGWILKDDRYRIKWFDGDQIPDNVGRVIDESPAEDEDSDEDYRYSLTSDESDNEDDNDVYNSI